MDYWSQLWNCEGSLEPGSQEIHIFAPIFSAAGLSEQITNKQEQADWYLWPLDFEEKELQQHIFGLICDLISTILNNLIPSLLATK